MSKKLRAGKKEKSRVKSIRNMETTPRITHRLLEMRAGLENGGAQAQTQADAASLTTSNDARSTPAELASSPDSPTMTSHLGSPSKASGRPYRSHKYPACARCHKRRSRCTVEIPGQACLLCRMHGVTCSSASMAKGDRNGQGTGFTKRSLISEKDSMDELSHFVGPIIARDTQVLEQYLPGGDYHEGRDRRSSTTTTGPVFFPLPPRRPSPSDCNCSRNLPTELLDQVEPYSDKLARLFFEEVNPCFPTVDELGVLTRIKDRSMLPHTFLCTLHAITMFYWDLSPALSPYPKLDQDFAWQVAMSSSFADFSKSDLSTIISIALNIAGRPSTCVVNNTMNIARLVALSHSIGLNHDPSQWKMPDEEKRTRQKTWWAVLISDRFYHFAQGTPPHVTNGHYDVPIPSMGLLIEGRTGSVKHVRAAECYTALCHLTEIVGNVLPLIFHIRSGNDTVASEQVSRSEIDLNRWTENLPAWLHLHDFNNRPAVPGLVNLQLSYLAVRMLLRRIGWHEITQKEANPHSSWLLGCFEAADEIVRFVTTLQLKDLRGFWLPYNSQHFTSAVTLLLRCALQTSYEDVRNRCMTSARQLVDFLRKAKEESRWDLADSSLGPSESILRRIEEALPRTPPLKSRTNSTDAQVPIADYLADPTVLDHSLGNGWQMSIEELFPEIFSDFTDTALFEGLHYDMSLQKPFA